MAGSKNPHDPSDYFRFPDKDYYNHLKPKGAAVPEPDSISSPPKTSAMEIVVRQENDALKNEIRENKALVRIAKQIIKALEAVAPKDNDAVVLVKIGDGQLAVKGFSNPEDATRVIDYRYVIKLLDGTANFVVPKLDGFYQDNTGVLYEYRDGKWIDKEPANVDELEFLG